MNYLNELSALNGLSPLWTIIVSAPVWLGGLIRAAHGALGVIERWHGGALERHQNRAVSNAMKSTTQKNRDLQLQLADRIGSLKKPPPPHPRPVRMWWRPTASRSPTVLEPPANGPGGDSTPAVTTGPSSRGS